MTVADVAALLRNAAAMLEVVREHYPVDPDAMAQVAAEQMVKLGVARREGEVLISQL